jgi:hypothetical protein
MKQNFDSITSLDLNGDAFVFLKFCGIHTKKQLAATSRRELEERPAPASPELLDHIEQVLAEKGLFLRHDSPAVDEVIQRAMVQIYIGRKPAALDLIRRELGRVDLTKDEASGIHARRNMILRDSRKMHALYPIEAKIRGHVDYVLGL